MSKIFLFQTIQFSQTVLMQTIRFSISMQLVLFNPWIVPLSGATTTGQSEPGSNGNEGVLRIPGTSPSDCLVSYPGYSLGGVLPLYREAVGVFYSPSRLGKQIPGSCQRAKKKLSNMKVTVIPIIFGALGTVV